MTAFRAATFTTVAALLATLLAGTGRAAAAPVTDPLIDQSGQAGYRDSAMRSPPSGLQGYEIDFINLAAPAAQAALVAYRVPASVGTAQAILESGWGRSTLSVNAKNYFGLKCADASTPGPMAIGCRPHLTRECRPICGPAIAYFRVYASMMDSFRVYGLRLSTSRYYVSAFQYFNDPDQFAREVARRYATDPEYANKVIRLMFTWNLYRFN